MLVDIKILISIDKSVNLNLLHIYITSSKRLAIALTMQEAENKQLNDFIPDNDRDSYFALWKPIIVEAIYHIKIIRHKRADINAIFDYIDKSTASNINKNVVENFISQLTKQKIIINKKTPAGCDSFSLNKKITMKLFPKKSLNPQ